MNVPAQGEVKVPGNRHGWTGLIDTLRRVDEFLGNTFANLIGTFVGAFLALVTVSRGVKIRDRRLIQSVINGLHRSRAFRPTEIGGHGDSPKDRQRCTDSILRTRDRIAAVSDELSGRAKAKGFGALEAMYVACNDEYLRPVDRDPNNYVDALMRLREALVVQVDALCASDKKLSRRLPGEGADRKSDGVSLAPSEGEAGTFVR